MLKTLCVFGTRPEAIKMAPLVKALSSSSICNQVCVSGQHQTMLAPILELFSIKPDYHFHSMTDGQSLGHLSSHILEGMDRVLTEAKPDLVLVHGDTSTTFMASLSAYYHKIPVAHVEAGLRSHHLYSPFPEEVNRKLTGHLAALHFAPTSAAEQNLRNEGIDESRIFVTGNTVIDALYHMVEKIEQTPHLAQALQQRFPMLSPKRRMILITGHRRENFGKGFENICHAISQIAVSYPEIDLVYPVHLNPNVSGPVKEKLGGIRNIHLLEPQDYLPFIYLMKQAYLILTDSGGIQEEAPALGKPVLVMRENTERPEAIDAGTAVLVGTEPNRIVENVSYLLDSEAAYQHMAWAHNPYGDGEAVQRIVEVIQSQVWRNSPLLQSAAIKEANEPAEMTNAS